jgi:RNA polymerase-binding protein DksA
VAKKLDLEKYKKLLIEEQERLTAEHHAVNSDLAERSGELADYDDHHPADAASETFERTKDYALDENYRDMLERISEALRKIDEGTYGFCDRCDRPINPERLKAIPYATMCIECQERVERR